MYRKNNVAKKRKINTKIIRASHYLYVDNINIYIIAKAVFLLLPGKDFLHPEVPTETCHNKASLLLPWSAAA